MFAVVVGVVSTSTVNLFFSENPIMSIETSSYNLLENSNHFFAIDAVEAAAAVRQSGSVRYRAGRRRSLVLAPSSLLLKGLGLVGYFA